MPKEIVVRLVNVEKYDDDWIPTDPAEAIKWIQKYLDMIPEKYRGTAELVFGASQKYEDFNPNLDFIYIRPETKEEVANRENRVTKETIMNEWLERQTYEHLKKKFESS